MEEKGLSLRVETPRATAESTSSIARLGLTVQLKDTTLLARATPETFSRGYIVGWW